MLVGTSDVREFDASIVITSRNRRDDVLRAVASCYAQEGVRLEVLVFDDASDDGSAEAVQTVFPDCRVYRSTEREGYIVNRNRGFRESVGRVVFSLDDDAYFSDVRTARGVLRSFDDETVGAAAIPYVEPLARRSASSIRVPFRANAGDELRSYVGCSHAVRRSAALSLGGYREVFVHQREEADLCLRLWAAGYRVVCADSPPVVHMVQRKANDPRVLYYGGRNLVIHEGLNAPMPDVFWRLGIGAFNYLRYEPGLGGLGIRLRALADGCRTVLRERHQRQAVPVPLYRRVRALPGHGPGELSGDAPPAVGTVG